MFPQNDTFSESALSKHKLSKTRMVVQGQLVEPAVCFSDLWAFEELMNSFIRQKQNNIMLRQQTFLMFMNQLE